MLPNSNCIVICLAKKAARQSLIKEQQGNDSNNDHQTHKPLAVSSCSNPIYVKLTNWKTDSTATEKVTFEISLNSYFWTESDPIQQSLDQMKDSSWLNKTWKKVEDCFFRLTSSPSAWPSTRSLWGKTLQYFIDRTWDRSNCLLHDHNLKRSWALVHGK